MNTTFGLLQKRWGSIALAGSLLALSLSITSPAIAGYRSRYPSAPRTPTTAGGTRGCSGAESATFIALAPQSDVGKTTSTHPTLAWFVPDAREFPISVYLYEYNDVGERQLVRQIDDLQSRPGIMSTSLPSDQPGLQPGRRYVWQVVLFCTGRNHPSGAIWSSAEIELLNAPSTLLTSLATANDPLERANLYAESGFWYDALAASLSTASPNARILQRSLLSDLVNLERGAEEQGQLNNPALNNATNAHSYSSRLRQLLAADGADGLHN